MKHMDRRNGKASKGGALTKPTDEPTFDKPKTGFCSSDPAHDENDEKGSSFFPEF